MKMTIELYAKLQDMKVRTDALLADAKSLKSSDFDREAIAEETLKYLSSLLTKASMLISNISK